MQLYVMNVRNLKCGQQIKLLLNRPSDHFVTTVRPLRGRDRFDPLTPGWHRGLFMFKPSGLRQAEHPSKIQMRTRTKDNASSAGSGI